MFQVSTDMTRVGKSPTLSSKFCEFENQFSIIKLFAIQ